MSADGLVSATYDTSPERGGPGVIIGFAGGDNARAYRPLGLGYTSLVSLLRCRGLGYRCDDGRA